MQIYYDKMGVPFKAAACSPFHCCFCIPLCGDVFAIAPHPMLASTMGLCLASMFCGICCYRFFPGLQDGEGMVTMANNARAEFFNRKGAVLFF